MKVLLMSDGSVGQEICKWMIENYPDDLAAIITVSRNQISNLAAEKAIPTSIYTSEAELLQLVATIGAIDLGILAWWPKLISGNIIRCTRQGFINTHPSYLPFNRGKHYNFWSIVEETPFGVTLHFVDEGIDSGDIVSQTRIPKGWEDTGYSLYLKAQDAMFSIFKDSYPAIREGKINRQPQDLRMGSLHYSHELDKMSRIDLEESYSARELLNLLRARTFPGRPACYFAENEDVYEVTVDIKKIDRSERCR